MGAVRRQFSVRGTQHHSDRITQQGSKGPVEASPIEHSKIRTRLKAHDALGSAIFLLSPSSALFGSLCIRPFRDRIALMAPLYIGTSVFTAAGWEGSFYPEGTKSADFLRYYAQHFNGVEIDSTFYRIPSEATVQGWANKTPEGFVFAAKISQVITHEKVLVDCDPEFKQFLDVMEVLGEKLGPLLFQFGYFNRTVFRGVNDFLARLRPFLKKLPEAHKFVVEIRNKNWLVPQFVETLRERGVALALIDQSWMPRSEERRVGKEGR